MEAQDRFIENLRASYVFPTEYTFKIIGESTPALQEAVLAVVQVEHPELEVQVTTRLSSGGRHQSLTLILTMPSPEAVVVLYQRFHAVPGVRMLL